MCWNHKQLNEETHNLSDRLFGVTNLETMRQVSICDRHHHIMTANKEDIYMTDENIRNSMNMPILFLHGEENCLFTPHGTAADLEMLQRVNPTKSHLYKRKTFKDYAHLDCFVGVNAAVDIFPTILQHLEETQKE